MTILNIRTVLLSLALATVTGCDAEDSGFGEGDVSLRPNNGIFFNTSWLGSFEFGEFQNKFGVWHKDTSLKGVKLSVLYKGNYESVELESVWAVDGQIYGKKGEQTYSGHQFDESFWSFQMMIDGNQTDVNVKIKSITDNNGKDWKYVFKHDYKATDGNGNCLVNAKEGKGEKGEGEGEGDDQDCLFPICEDDPDMLGVQYDAIVTGDITVDTLTGNIDKAEKPSMYWGCVSGAVGKAGNWGYRLEHLGDVEAFQGAVRMVRADYCGTGDSFTTPGQMLTTTDIYGISNLTQSYKLETLWDSKGATCVHMPRMASDWPDATAVIKTCDMLGAPRIPKECDPSDDLNTYQDVLYMSANPT